MTRERLRRGLWGGAALLAGLALRLWMVRRFANVSGDSLVYGAIAKNWIQHGVYGFVRATTAAGDVVVRPTLIRLPGYPAFLAACFRVFGAENYRAVMYVQAVADLLTCWLAAALAGRLWGARAYLPVLWLACVCPFTANYVVAPLTETLVLTTIALAFYALARWQDAGMGYGRWLWVVAGALAGSTMLRPEQGLLAAAVLPAMVWVSSRGSRGLGAMRVAGPVLAVVLCVALPFVPWTIRNWRVFHVVQPLAPRAANDPGDEPLGGFNRWYRTWAIDFASTDMVYWNYNGDVIRMGDLPVRAFAPGCDAHGAIVSGPGSLYARTAALLEDYNRTTTTSRALEARFDGLARERIGADPVCYYLGLPVARVLNMMVRPRVELLPISDEWWKAGEHPGKRAWAVLLGAVNLVYFALAMAGFRAWRSWDAGGGARAVVWAMVACVVMRGGLLLTLDNSETRYTLEFFPVLFVLAGAAAVRARAPEEISGGG